MDYAGVDSRDRRLVIITSSNRQDILRGKIDWKLVAEETLPLGSSIVGGIISGLLLGPSILSPYFLWKILKHTKNVPRLPYPVFDIVEARDQFKFPINHPVDGGVYACCDAEPMLYVPLASFHRYMYEAKVSAFQQLCANLGVHRCTIVYAEENGSDITAKFAASSIPTQVGPISLDVKGERNRNSRENASVFAEYPYPNTLPTRTNTNWMNGEPTWTMMESLRLERNLERHRAEFNYSSDMGVSGDVAAKIAKVGLSIGGKYEEMKHIKWVFDVEFWPMV